MARVYTCALCGHRSAVKSNFKGISSGKLYCNSDLRPDCDTERRFMDSYTKPKREYDFNHIEGWK